MERAEKGLLQALPEGITLFKRMDIALDVAKGLKAIHDIGYIHEDLKPGNILVCLILINTQFLVTTSIHC